jgi:predicted nucleic acid-binding protein
MADRAFLDSNVLLYAVGDDDGRRHVAETLLAQRPVVSAQVLAEVSAVLRRKFGQEPLAVAAILEAVLARVHCEPIAAETVLSALRWGDSLGYSHYDSQITAAALPPTAARCTPKTCSTAR